MRKLFKNKLLIRFLTAQLPGLAILVVLFSGEIFKAPILVQSCFTLFLASNIFLNLYFINKSESGNRISAVSGQTFFTILTLFMLLFAAYRLITVGDEFQKLIALISTILLFVLFVLLVWGARYARRYESKNK
ncbi:putative immunity protein, BLpL-like protein [Streptococcus sp. DD11]|uniref:immunity protein n=1 Tax=Streptococcus sp. DD11 TaxID=1777879 RepID=UPI00079178C9|nr:immunity protein [Streptococcus sp. DD11]KXT84074.1 putative immunity protein, BLpL-like protein [Streptococcus sp. DD11]